LGRKLFQPNHSMTPFNRSFPHKDNNEDRVNCHPLL
jgi:hypothetical protein